ncbi:winged helix-turn-helix domain-containing protein [Nonomuraea thailandensis]
MKAILHVWGWVRLAHDAGQRGAERSQGDAGAGSSGEVDDPQQASGGGSATATEVAEIAGITPSAASYHLRMLAKYGFVEDAPPRGTAGSGCGGGGPAAERRDPAR